MAACATPTATEQFSGILAETGPYQDEADRLASPLGLS